MDYINDASYWSDNSNLTYFVNFRPNTTAKLSCFVAQHTWQQRSCVNGTADGAVCKRAMNREW